MGLTIGGVDYDSWLRKESLKLAAAIGSEPDTLDFELQPYNGAGVPCPPPTEGAEVLYTWLGDVLPSFGGALTSKVEAPRAANVMGWTCGALDWRIRADRAILNDRIYDATGGEVADQLFAKYAPEFDRSGIDLTGVKLPLVRFTRDQHLTEALDVLSGLTGYVWDLTPDRRLLWGAMGAQLAAFQLVDGSLNFEDLAVEVNREQLRNRVIVRGGSAPSTSTTTDRFTQDAGGLTATFPLAGLPVGLDTYEVFRGDFTSGIDAGDWSETDQSNPTPPAGHLPANGYMMTTIQAGAAVVESGWLQVLGGNGIPGAVRLMSAQAFERVDRRRFEWEVSATAITSEARFGLWDPNNQAAAAGELYGLWQSSGTLKPSIGGVQQGATTTTITAGNAYRVRITLKGAGGAVIQVNKDSTGDLLLPADQRVAWRASQWITLLDTAIGTGATFTVAGVWNTSASVRVRRVRVYNPLNDITLTVGGVSNVVGLLGVDEDSGCDALVGAGAGGLPQLFFFPDTRPAAAAAVVIVYRQGIPILVVAPDNESIAYLAAIEADASVPDALRGVYEHYINDPTLTSREMAMARALQELEQHAWPVVGLTFRTRWPAGLRPGQILQPALTPAGSGRTLSGSFLVTAIDSTSKGGGHLIATVKASSKLRGTADYFLELLKLGRRASAAAEDDNAPLEELTSHGDTAAVTDTSIVGESDLPPYLYGDLIAAEDGDTIITEDGDTILTDAAARYGHAAHAA